MTQVAAAVAPGDREGEADAPGEAGEQAVRQAQMAVGLGQHERDAPRHRRRPHRAGDVPAAAHHDVGPHVAQDAMRGADGADGPHGGARRLERVAAAQALDADRAQLVAGGRDELGLGPLPADEDDLGALSPQLVGDRYRGDDVTGCPAGCDQHSDLLHARILAHRAASGPPAASRCPPLATLRSSPIAPRRTTRLVEP